MAPVSLLAYGAWLAVRAWGDPIVLPVGMVDHAVGDVHRMVTVLTSGPWQASVKSGSLWDVTTAALMAISSDLVNALSVLGVVALLVSWVLLFSYTLRPFPASPAILVANLGKRFSLSEAEAQTDFRQRFQRHFGQVAHALQPRTMVIFIDDLDRCTPDKSAELLEAANYLCDAGPCFIILGMAREIVEAQVANAHKVVAEEQAAMQRVRRGQVMIGKEAKEAANEVDRLAYAQKYLRKLVQLDVALPRLDTTKSIQLLLNKLGADAASVSISAKKANWLSPRLRGVLLLWLALLGAAGALVWRTPIALKAIEVSRLAKVQDLLDDTSRVRGEVEHARVYTHWLGDMAAGRTAATALPPTVAASAAKASKTPATVSPPAPAASAAADITLPTAPSGSPLLYKAKADMMKSVLRDMETGLAALEREAREGRGETFDKVKERAFHPANAVYTAYIESPQIDGRMWHVIEKGLRPGITVDLNASAQSASAGQAGLDVRRSDVPTTPAVVADSPVLDPNMGVFIFAMGLLLVGIFRAKDDYVVQPTPEYENAVQKWQQLLLGNPDTATPRELKRFMNLSRYAVARLQTATAGAELPITETRIVELAAKWLASVDKADHHELRQDLGKDGAKPEELALFLEIVGDLSSGAPETASLRQANNADPKDTDESSDRQEDA